MHDVNKATINTSAILAVYIYKGENSAIAIDANERRHAHELNFFLIHHRHIKQKATVKRS
jgi:hypothetical protein